MFEEAFLQSLMIKILWLWVFLCIFHIIISINIFEYIFNCTLSFSAHFFSESNCGLSILTLCLSILAAFILTVKSDFIIFLFLDILCIPEIFYFLNLLHFHPLLSSLPFILYLFSLHLISSCLPLFVSFASSFFFSPFLKFHKFFWIN